MLDRKFVYVYDDEHDVLYGSAEDAEPSAVDDEPLPILGFFHNEKGRLEGFIFLDAKKHLEDVAVWNAFSQRNIPPNVIRQQVLSGGAKLYS